MLRVRLTIIACPHAGGNVVSIYEVRSNSKVQIFN